MADDAKRDEIIAISVTSAIGIIIGVVFFLRIVSGAAQIQDAGRLEDPL